MTSHAILNKFPISPKGIIAWPWAVESTQLPPLMSNGKPWPKISVVTPSYNQGQYLEETIRSVLLQNYPNLEYIIIDGGSTDNSVEIIKKYELWLTHWVSEKDRGQAHAIVKGLALCTGEIFNWINSDDYLAEGALRLVAESFGEADLVTGAVRNFGEGGDTFVRPAELTARGMVRGDGRVVYQQPSAWLRRDSLISAGGIDEGFHYCFDWLMTIRYLDAFPRVVYLPDVLAHFRKHDESKTSSMADGFSVERMLLVAALLHEEEFRLKYFEEIYTYLSESVRTNRVNMIRDRYPDRKTAVARLLRDMVDNVRTYPYRYTLGAIRRVLSGGNSL